MFRIRIHGRGGQGVVTAAELLSLAAFADGRFAQAFPSFGSERMGAPVTASCRIADDVIRTREPIALPDAVIVQDATLLHQLDVFEGLGRDGFLVVNSSRERASLGIDDVVRRLRPERAVVVAGTELALEHLGRPLPGAALLGGLAALTVVVSLRSLLTAIDARFTGRPAEGNSKAATTAYDTVTCALRELLDA
jgi:pyruvate ferredoxin oxidoreductase gamma subunit